MFGFKKKKRNCCADCEFISPEKWKSFGEKWFFYCLHPKNFYAGIADYVTGENTRKSGQPCEVHNKNGKCKRFRAKPKGEPNGKD